MRSRGRVVDKEGVLVSFLVVLMKYLSRDSLMVEGLIWRCNPMAQSIMWGRHSGQSLRHLITLICLEWPLDASWLHPTPFGSQEAEWGRRMFVPSCLLFPHSDPVQWRVLATSKVGFPISGRLGDPSQPCPKTFFLGVIFRSSQTDNHWASLRASYSKALSFSHSPQPLSSSH